MHSLRLPILVILLAAVTVVEGGLETCSLDSVFNHSLSELFQARPGPNEWMGADVSYSFALPGNNVGGLSRHLWVWGDTLVGQLVPGGDPPSGKRRELAGFPRNSVAVVTHPSSRLPVPSDAQFFWVTNNGTDPNGCDNCATQDGMPACAICGQGRPDSFFSPPHYSQFMNWFWVFCGLQLGPSTDIVLFANTIVNTTGGMGFMGNGTWAIRVPNADQPPSNWTYTTSRLPVPNPAELSFGLAVSFVPDSNPQMVLITGSSDLVDARGTVLAQISTDDLLAFDWTGLQWLMAAPGTYGPPIWSNTLVPSSLIKLFPSAGESTLEWHPALERWVVLLFDMFGSTTVQMHSAPNITGPWSVRPLYNVPAPYNDTKLWFCYAVKSHPQLAGWHQIVFTFMCNGFSLAGTLNNTQIYIPSFVSVTLSEDCYSQDDSSGLPVKLLTRNLGERTNHYE